MRYRHQGSEPRIDKTAYVAPTAVLCGDVRIGPGSAVSFGAVLTAEDGTIDVGHDCVIMENAVIRASKRARVRIGNHVLVGPRAYLTGCTVEDNVFLAAGSTIFNHAVIGARAEVRINGVVHIRTHVPPDATVPIGWVAVGDPVRILPPNEHEKIWAAQEPLDFPKVVFGLDRPIEGETIMPELTRRYAGFLRRRHGDDVAVG
ncbi:MAG: gamma carbonic anhydrase family protein [Proteobacteria bacterium]|nr:gamma carbonic anhydrase family protein [Pseudomonadota bacterium]